MSTSKRQGKIARLIRKIPVPAKRYGLRRFTRLGAAKKLTRLQKAQYKRIETEFTETPKGKELKKRVRNAFDYYLAAKLGEIAEREAPMVRKKLVYFREFLLFAKRKVAEKGLYESTIERIEIEIKDLERKKARHDCLDDIKKFF